MEIPKILIVEDDYDTLQFLRLFLQNNFEIKDCGSNEGFYELIENFNFDLIIMDIAIKGNKNGLQITREMKTSDKYKHIPILCLSAHVMEQDRRNALTAGADKFLPKPVANHILMKTILGLLKK
ncbi:MAG: response regulator [Bacteroidetes bacterium]|nr:response regulator [Bacteroidota bacterium]